MESFHSHNEELSLKLLIVLSRAFHKVAERIKEDIRSHNLNTTEFAVLELLYHKGDQPIQQIGKKILLSSGSITYVIDKLEEKKLVSRKNCPKDRRVIYATITDEGKRLMDVVFPEHKKSRSPHFPGAHSGRKTGPHLSAEEIGFLVGSLIPFWFLS